MDALFQDFAATVPWLRVDLLGRLLLATLLGGLIGWDREAHGKPAGLRTNILICVGAALLSDISVRFGGLSVTDLARPDPARLAAQIVSGIGFLGAGTIIQARGSVTGLTTAATLWVVAAIGIAVGAGFHVEAIGSAVLVFLVLMPLGRLERRLALSRRNRTLKVEMARGPEAIEGVTKLVEAHGMSAYVRVLEAGREHVAVTFDLSGDKEAMAQVRDVLLERADVVKVTLS